MTAAEIIAIIGALSAAAVAIINAVAGNVKQKRLSEKVSKLENFLQSDNCEYIIQCPQCNTKIYLSKVKIYTEVKNDDKL